MKNLALLLCAVMLLSILAACGSKDSKDSNSGSTKDEGKIVYKAFNGDITVPKHPTRVVEVADSYVGDLLVLGIKPVGVSQNALDNPYFKGKLDGTANLGKGDSVEKILELQPDLIIAPSYVDAAILEKLTKIAPTVAIEYGKLNVREQLREFGKMTGYEDKAEDWVKAWDKKITEAKPKVQAVVGTKTVSILQPYAKGIYAFGSTFGRGGEIIYTELGLKAPAAVQKEAIDNKQGWANLSLEKLPEYAGDYIFTSAWSGDDTNPDAVYGSSIWKSLPAVTNKHVYMLDKKGSFFTDPVSMNEQFKLIVDSLTK